MAQVRNFDALKALKVSAQLQEGIDVIPDNLQTTVVPVIDITPRIHRVCNIVRSATSTGTTQTIYATPSDKDFYIVGANLSMIKDASATSVATSISITVDGVIQALCTIAGFTLTAQNQTVPVVLIYPIKVDRGSNITVSNSTTLAVITVRAQIQGYTVDNPQGN